MKKSILLIFSTILLFSCAKLPVQSIQLMESITNEGKRMHQLNVATVNALFKEKQMKIDTFFKNNYTPTYLSNYLTLLPAGPANPDEFKDMIKSIFPRINETRDAMQSTLETNRKKIIDKLNQDFNVYQECCKDLKDLLSSAVKVNEATKSLINKTSQITGLHLDFDKLDSSLDKFITSSAEYGQKATMLDETINAILNK